MSRKKKAKVHESSWHMPDDAVYIGRENYPEQTFMIYIGGPYYQDSAQIHLNRKQAVWLKNKLNRLLPKRGNKT